MKKPYKLDTREYAIYLYTERGWGYTRIGNELGCASTTVRRWVNPEYDEAQRKASLARKKKMTGICEVCGGKTKYNGHGGNNSVSRICATCSRANQRYWTREKIIEAIQRWTREHDGVPPTSMQWMHRGEYWPSATAIYSDRERAVFPSWNEALRAAGVPLHRPKGAPGPGKHWWPRDEARVLYDQGWTLQQIADKYGVTDSAIGHVFGYRNSHGPRRPKALGKRTREQRIDDLRKALENQESV